MAIERSAKLIRINKDTPRIVVSPDAITHAFIEMTTQDQEGYSSAVVLDAVLELNKKCNRRLWNAVIKGGTSGAVTYASFHALAGSDGYPPFNPAATFSALQGIGLNESSSLVIIKAVTKFDGGQSKTRVYVGFAFRDRASRLLSQDGDNLCIPPAGFRVVEE